MDFDKYRPYFIQCEPSEHFQPGAADKIAGLLETRGYFLVARTEINLIFVDRALLMPSAARRAFRSFDVFDTLIARNCIEPHLHLRACRGAHAKSPVLPPTARSRAARVPIAPIMLDDIYDELMKIRGWSQDERDARAGGGNIP